MAIDEAFKVNIVPSSSAQDKQTSDAHQPTNPMSTTAAPVMPTKLHFFSYNGEKDTDKGNDR